MNSTRTLWMGNIEQWMDEAYILSLFNSFEIYPIKINIKKKDQAKGCCFVEMENQAIANNVLESLNGKRLQDFVIKLNWVNQKSKDHQDQQQQMATQKKYTIYVGNLHKAIKSEELRLYFKEDYPSVIAAKVIYEPLTQISKSFGFVDFLSYEEYQHVLYSKTIRTLRNMKLIINSTKAKKNEEKHHDYNGNYNNNHHHCNNQSTISHILSESNYKDYIPKGFDNSTNNSSHYNNTNTSFIDNQTTCASITNLLTIESNVNHIEDFNLALQKGFKEIANMYKSSVVKPKISFQCHYYCNLNAMMPNVSSNIFQNEECFGEVNHSQFIEAFAKNIQKNININ